MYRLHLRVRSDKIMRLTQSPSFVTMALCVVAGFLLLPFIYLTSLAALLSAYVHGCSLPSREFLRVYAKPSNTMVAMPQVGGLYSNYFEFCVRITGADYDPNTTQ
jgi:hypothetical protein